MTFRRSIAIAGAGAATWLALSAPAGAHVSTNQETVEAGVRSTIVFSIGHGCEDAATTKVSMQIPEGILNASPLQLGGWNITTTHVDLKEPVKTEHGEVTDRVSEIVWTALTGNELPHDFRQVFTVGFTAPETVGNRLFFKTVQTCTTGANNWIDETKTGETEPEDPAPFVDVVKADEDSDSHGHTATTETKGDEVAVTTAASTSSEKAAAKDDSDGSSNLGPYGLGITAIALSGAALVRSRGRSAT